MTKFFSADEKKLLKRYNQLIFLINILPLSILLTLIALVIISRNTSQPLSYYYGVAIVFCAVSGYSFFTVLIGSIVMTKRLKYNKLHTYVDILNKNLIVSSYTQSSKQGKQVIAYKKLWIIKLSEIQDIYYYKRNIVVIAPTRFLNEQADWLTYTDSREGIYFDNWWYNLNGGKTVSGVKIPDMFTNPQRVARTIQNFSGKIQLKEAERKIFKERMLKIARKNNYKN